MAALMGDPDKAWFTSASLSSDFESEVQEKIRRGVDDPNFGLPYAEIAALHRAQRDGQTDAPEYLVTLPREAYPA
jgi:hypothetical protein